MFGETLSHSRIVGKIGAGGVGEVFQKRTSGTLELPTLEVPGLYFCRVFSF